MSFSRLIESGPVGTVKVDREAGVIRDVKILGRTSKNRRVYTDGAMDDAVRLYEGRRVFFDHNDRSDRKKERRFQEFGGVLSNVRKTGDGVYGDLLFVKSDPLASKLAESAERFPNAFGLSHNAEGRTRQDRDTLIVESLIDVESVDIVTRPAAVEGLFESQELEPKEEKTMSVTKTTLAILLEQCFPGKAAACGLLEMDGMPALPIESATDASLEDNIWAAFKGAIMAAIDDESLDIKSTLKKVGEILKAYDKLAGETVGKATAAESTMSESIRESLEAIKAVADKAEKRSLAAAMCSEKGVAPTVALLEELVKLPSVEAMAERLAVEQPTKARPNVTALRESRIQGADLPKNAAELAAMLR